MVRLCFALRRDPLKPLLAATALHYGGLVPMHITYDEPNQCAAQVIRCGRVGMQCARILCSPPPSHPDAGLAVVCR